MIQSESLRPSWEFSSLSLTNSLPSLFQESYTETDFYEPLPFDDYPIDVFLMDTEKFDLESILCNEFGSPDHGGVAMMEDIGSSSSQQWSPSSSLKSEISSSPSWVTQQSMVVPTEDMEIDNKLRLHHLMKAYGEAMEHSHGELMEVISKCAADRADPLGKPHERLAFNLFCRDREDDYRFLEEGSRKNFEAAFSAFYQIFPLGRFAHFAANRAILESLPRHAKTLHVVDCDLWNGIQWAPVIDAIGTNQVHRITLRITSIKCDADEETSHRDHCLRLYAYARAFEVELMVEEMTIEELASDLKRKGRDSEEWIVFNCMVWLPHMVRRRSRNHVEKFLSVAQEMIRNHANGIITLGEGDGVDKLKYCSGFGEFFEGCLGHYQTLMELMDSELPSELAEARLAMESLFVSPFVSSSDWVNKWEEITSCLGGVMLEGVRISRENLMEAMELVRGKSFYGVRVGEKENEMVLEWRDTPLVRFSTWGR